MAVVYRTTMRLVGRNTGIPVPTDVLDELGGGRRPAVSVTANDYACSSTVGAMGGEALVPFSAAHRAASGISGGDPLEVSLAIDDRPREVTVPDDLATALGTAGLTDAFDRLSPSRRAADAAAVEGAKAAATRERRIEAVVARLTT